MGIYIGFIEKKQTYFNFKPLAEIQGTQVEALTDNEVEELLPNSEKLNINFYYDSRSDDEFQWMDKTFPENSLIIFEFTLEDLEDNYLPSGGRNPTGYKIQARKMWDKGKIRAIEKDNVYYIIKREDLRSDFFKDNIVDINVPFINKETYAFIELDNFYAGPYKVVYNNRLITYCIKPQIKEHKYTVSGYSRKDINTFKLEHSQNTWTNSETFFWPVSTVKKNAKESQIDVIDDEGLLENFREYIQSDEIINGSVQINDIPGLLNKYNESVFSGSFLTEEICQNRLKKLSKILTANEDVENTLNEITDVFCDLLVRRKNDPKVNEWLKQLFEEHPELINQLGEMQAVTEQVELQEQRLADVSAELEQKQEKLEETSQEETSIYQEAREKLENELREKNDEYKEAQQRIEDISESLNISNNLAELKEKQEELQSEVNYLGSHKSHLEQETGQLELEFEQLINKQHEDMVNIAFDGFMSSKMLNAASEWEEEESSKQHEELVCKVNNIDVPDMTTEDLIEYLCNTIQILRPSYSKNTIVNIMICISQGFLTVFSGEPGCGKTSICNIIGDVLGLNKIADEINAPEELKDEVNRYVPVSVERGWTSNRDFIGYYNPLSKVFDKSNRSVYDALYQLDTEKQKDYAKFPYIILLDESNLSPMEYYWSDFMNVCDDLGPQSKVNLGDNYVFGIPETLHFVATINNDHTTETLSPRLIDRAWIISLPKQENGVVLNQTYDQDQIKIVKWESIKNAFIPREEDCVFSADIQRIYDSIVSHLRKGHFTVSPRIEIAIKKYWAIASKRFEKDEMGTDPAIVALDYAIMQKILPKITGNGPEFKEWIEGFKKICSNNGLNMSCEILGEIIDRGDRQMQYYQFFA